MEEQKAVEVDVKGAVQELRWLLVDAWAKATFQRGEVTHIELHLPQNIVDVVVHLGGRGVRASVPISRISKDAPGAVTELVAGSVTAMGGEEGVLRLAFGPPIGQA